MQRKVRLKDVAERAGVAVNTASTILNRRPNSWASKETETRVFLAAKELGYRPSKTARALQSGRYHAIGLLIQDLANPFFAALADEIEAAVEDCGYDLIIANCRSSLVRESHLFDGLHGMEVDGAITYLSDNESFRTELAERFTEGSPWSRWAMACRPNRCRSIACLVTLLKDSRKPLTHCLRWATAPLPFSQRLQMARLTAIGPGYFNSSSWSAGFRRLASWCFAATIR
jgi:transcriptional regulator with XRE-family HTH domain